MGTIQVGGGVHKGRPNKEDLNQAAAFAEDMKEKISDE